MIIGFKYRNKIIIERFEILDIAVHSKIISELEYEIGFRHAQGRNPIEATVETGSSADPTFNADFDARFGDRPDPNNPFNRLEAFRILQKGHLEPLAPLRAVIYSDFRPEGDECFTITIFTRDTGRDFMCNEDQDNPDDFFCDHTICILNDDG